VGLVRELSRQRKNPRLGLRQSIRLPARVYAQSDFAALKTGSI